MYYALFPHKTKSWLGRACLQPKKVTTLERQRCFILLVASFRGRFFMYSVLFLPLFNKTSRLHSALLTQLTNQRNLAGLGCINCGLSLLSFHARCNQVPLESVVSGVPRVLFHLSLFFLSERCIVEHPWHSLVLGTHVLRVQEWFFSLVILEKFKIVIS